MKPKARVGDYVRIVRPNGHSLAAEAPIGEVIRVAAVCRMGDHLFYRSARSTALWRSDELELVNAQPRRGRPSKRDLRNRRVLERLGLYVAPNPKPRAVRTYGGAHTRVRRERGRPNHCEHCGASGKQRYEWAYTGPSHDAGGKPFTLNVDDYVSLCVLCHHAFDRVLASKPTECPQA